MFIETKESGQVLDRIVFIFQSEMKPFTIPWNKDQKKFSRQSYKENSVFHVLQFVVNLESGIRSQFGEAIRPKQSSHAGCQSL